MRLIKVSPVCAIGFLIASMVIAALWMQSRWRTCYVLVPTMAKHLLTYVESSHSCLMVGVIVDAVPMNGVESAYDFASGLPSLVRFGYFGPPFGSPLRPFRFALRLEGSGLFAAASVPHWFLLAICPIGFWVCLRAFLRAGPRMCSIEGLTNRGSESRFRGQLLLQWNRCT